MATKNFTTLRIGGNESHDIYLGTKEQLVAAGLIEDQPFPGEHPFERKRVLDSYLLNPDKEKKDWCGDWRIWRRAGGKFELTVWVSKEEWDRRRAEKSHREWKLQGQQLQRETLQQPDGARKLAEEHLNIGVPMLIAAFNLTNSPDRPWRFPAEVRDRADVALRELCALFMDNPVTPLRVAVAETDPAFQRFIGKLGLEGGKPE